MRDKGVSLKTKTNRNRERERFCRWECQSLSRMFGNTGDLRVFFPPWEQQLVGTTNEEV